MSDDYEIDLTIEAVTGTVYDLCVSPFETILGIKTKIQKLEGIPVSQQHLIYGSTELMDDLCLEECHVRSGSQLKLVIAMRGGPIHAHRIQLEDFAILELAEFLESQSPDEQDQYAAIFVSNEDTDVRSQLHSPVEVSESRLRGGSQTSLVATTNPTKVLPTFENDVTQSKMKELQSRLKCLRLSKTEALLSKALEREQCSKMLRHDGSSIYPPPIHTPPSCTCGCHKKCCKCSCHVIKSGTQRQLCFTPFRESETYQKRHSRVHTPSSKDFQILDRLSSGRLRHGDKRGRPCGPTTGCSKATINDEISRKGSKQHSVKLVLSNDTQEHVQHRDDMKLKSGHFLPPIDCIVSTKQTKPRKEVEHSNFHLPPINPKNQVNIERNKCMKCQKRTRLANSYTCRCGGVYCSIHRYAETHSCTFNYKAEGKELIARNNPLVTAPKLSKF
ncbi:PREDICTED: AN1-type zinc finger protein 4-like [Amphimedon queenslandica]|uniref:AN1-type domain-containing protein n=1 Tax=Amphimedon queenslandica TaxID=400682 RepID=A0A1X7UP01_AMPQE|nr:PREDICTED: AN1-type zinc finger protein 4-like [Amphimedon queenslandica]|eukprot:XP_019853109.1 PREDICTED: AN1-type zinc finger protein 4-like [Amphimedon queenslandica]